MYNQLWQEVTCAVVCQMTLKCNFAMFSQTKNSDAYQDTVVLLATLYHV